MKNIYKFSSLFLIVLSPDFLAQTLQHVNMGSMINSEYSENGPKISPDGKTLYFWRWRSQDEKSKKYGHDIWRSELGADGKWEEAKKMKSPFNTGSFNAVEGVGRNGNSLLLHGAFIKGKASGKGFSMSTKTDDAWSAPQKLEVKDFEKMDLGKYSGGTLSNDGTVLVLCFSEIKDSEENDLYVSFKEIDGAWSRPKSMGKSINSGAGEAGPFISADGATLYFASRRSGGVGCYDIYMATRKDNTWENWTEPKNLGSSVNTNVCDIHFSIDAKEENAYLGTVNNSQFGDEDIVTVKLDDNLKPKKTLDILTSDSMSVRNKIDASVKTAGTSNSVVDSAKIIVKESFLNSKFNSYNFIIYPNPTDVNFFLELTGTTDQNLIVTIIDMGGMVITNEQIEHLDGMFTKRFDVSGYSKGIYFVTITDGVSIVSKRLVIQ